MDVQRAPEVVVKEVSPNSLFLKKPLVLVFTKNPVLGKVKTRLGKSIGAEKALIVYRLLLEKTAAVLSELDCDIHLYYSETIENSDVFDALHIVKKVQKGNDLGQRMSNAFKESLANNTPVIIVGTDLWTLEKEDFTTSIAALMSKDVVLGPSEDGGYYLLGLNHHIPELFENKEWGTASVLKSTLKDLSNHEVHLLPKKNDIDNLNDLTAHPELFNKIA